MKRITYIVAASLLPASLAAQQDPVARLAEVLPPDVSAQVIEQVEAARSRDLPAQAAANLALEGVAKGRSGQEVLTAVESLVGDFGQAQDALQSAGRAPGEGEIEAATAALRMGVDGSAISDLARSQPGGRSLSVPLLVMGGLAERGLSSDAALAAVRDRLQARADDAALMGEFPGVGQGLGRGMQPNQVGPGLASGMSGMQVPVSGVTVPVGPQSENPRGRGRGRSGGPGGD